MFKDLVNFFHFHKREQRGVVLLLLLSVVLIAVNYSLPYFVEPEFDKARFEALVKTHDSLIKINDNKTFTEKNSYSKNNLYAEEYSNVNVVRFKPFYFNPNTVKEAELMQIGFNNRFIKSFINFRSKGKVFKDTLDFKKVFGLKNEEYIVIKDFLTFPEQKNEFEDRKQLEVKKREEQVIVDVNLADTTALMKLKGIGAAFAKRIVMYRNKLGGFYKKEQLMEVWGIDSSLYNFIEPYVVVGNHIRKIDLNKVELNQLKNHPYLNFNVANSIIQIRNRIGGFKNVEDIKKSVILKPETYEKIKPYLIVLPNES